MARPRKDIMKPTEIQVGEVVKSEGGMAHSLNNEKGMWGTKVPPYPRSELMGKKKVGMAFTRDSIG